MNGQQYRIDTSGLTRTKKGKGKGTAAFIGGGSGLGMLTGGVATEALAASSSDVSTETTAMGWARHPAFSA